MAKIFLSFHADPNNLCRALLERHQRQWAERSGYEMIWDPEISDLDLGGRSGHWAKVALIQKYLRRCDLLLWVDHDLLLAGLGDPSSEFYSQDFQAISYETTPHGFGPNTGLWLLRNEPRAHEFLGQVWDRGPVPGALLNDQARVGQLLGWSTLPHFTKPMDYSPWLAGTGWISEEWNMLQCFHPGRMASAKGLHLGGFAEGEKYAWLRQHYMARKLTGWQELLGDDGAEGVVERYPHPLAGEDLVT